MRFTVSRPGLIGVLSDFPVLVVLNGLRVNMARFLAGGADVRFARGQPAAPEFFFHEVEQWDATGTALLWVRVPQLTTGMTFDM